MSTIKIRERPIQTVGKMTARLIALSGAKYTLWRQDYDIDEVGTSGGSKTIVYLDSSHGDVRGEFDVTDNLFGYGESSDESVNLNAKCTVDTEAFTAGRTVLTMNELIHTTDEVLTFGALQHLTDRPNFRIGVQVVVGSVAGTQFHLVPNTNGKLILDVASYLKTEMSKTWDANFFRWLAVDSEILKEAYIILQEQWGTTTLTTGVTVNDSANEFLAIWADRRVGDPWGEMMIQYQISTTGGILNDEPDFIAIGDWLRINLASGHNWNFNGVRASCEDGTQNYSDILYQAITMPATAEIEIQINVDVGDVQGASSAPSTLFLITSNDGIGTSAAAYREMFQWDLPLGNTVINEKVRLAEACTHIGFYATGSLVNTEIDIDLNQVYIVAGHLTPGETLPHSKFLTRKRRGKIWRRNDNVNRPWPILISWMYDDVGSVDNRTNERLLDGAGVELWTTAVTAARALYEKKVLHWTLRSFRINTMTDVFIPEDLLVDTGTEYQVWIEDAANVEVSEIMKLDVLQAERDDGVYLAWRNSLGGWEFWMFDQNITIDYIAGPNGPRKRKKLFYEGIRKDEFEAFADLLSNKDAYQNFIRKPSKEFEADVRYESAVYDMDRTGAVTGVVITTTRRSFEENKVKGFLELEIVYPNA